MAKLIMRIMLNCVILNSLKNYKKILYFRLKNDKFIFGI